MTEPSLPEESIFAQALEITSAAERAAFLDRACGDNPPLRAEVEALLRAHERSGDLLDLPEHAQPTADLPACESPGTIIGPFKLLEQIGEGGMGAVWMAEQTEPIQRRVAVKVVKEGMDSKLILARFEAERQALALMDHPNIAKVFEAGRTPSGRPYFVMELVKGQPITKYCDTKRLGVRERLELFGDACRAVQHAHQKGIIHRDLKPSNVLVAPYDGKPVVKVIDFGLAKATGQRLTDKTLFTGFGSLVGTPEYMSPEQAEVNNQDIDTRSDIYSLGVLLYELLTGSTPLTRKRVKEATLLEVLRVIREEEPPRPSTRLSESKESLPSISAQRHTEPGKLAKLVRGELDWMVMKALEKDRNRRYETANGFAMDVQRYLSDEPVLACPPSVGYRLRKLVRRNKRRLAVASLLLFFVMVLAAGGAWVVIEKGARAQRLKTQIEQILDDEDRLAREQNWSQARAAVERAEAALASGDADDARRQRVRDARRDLEFISQLDRIRQESQMLLVLGKLDPKEYVQKYALAFREYGVDVETLPTEDAITRLQARPALAVPIADALDHWAMLTLNQETPHWAPLVAVARGLDGDPIRNRLRAFIGQRTTPETLADLVRLAESVDVKTQSPTTLYVLAATLMLKDKWEAALRILRDGQYAYPDDFWLNLSLGANLNDRKDHAGGVRYFSAAVALRPDSLLALNDLGLALDELGKRAEADACYRKAIALDRELTAPLTNLGASLLEQKKLDEAIECYEKAVKLAPRSSTPHAGLGAVLAMKNDLEGGLREHRIALEINPKDVYAHTNLGIVLSKKKDAEGAIAEFKAAIAIDDKFAGAHQGLGSELCKMKDFEGALRETHAALEIDPKLALAHVVLGNIFSGTNKLKEAIDEYNAAIEIDPKLVEAHWKLGHFFLKVNDAAGAIHEYQIALELEPNDPGNCTNLGNALLQNNDLNQAKEQYEAALKIDPKFAPAHYALGNLWRQKNNLDEAIREFDKALEFDPKFAEAYANWSDALIEKGDFRGAIKKCNEGIIIDFHYALLHNNLAVALSRLNNPKAAIGEYHLALDIDPDCALAHLGLGSALDERDELENKIKHWRRALELGLHDANMEAGVHFDIGRLLDLQGGRNEAITEFKKAASIKPDNADAYLRLANDLLLVDRLDEAISASRSAIHYKKDFALAYGILAHALRAKGEFREALAQARHCRHLAPDQPYASKEQIHEFERCVELDDKLSDFLTGKTMPASAQERSELAMICSAKALNASAARFYGEAFKGDNKLAAAHRFYAARVAAMAGCGQAKDIDWFGDAERSGLRRQALAWLHDELEAARLFLEKENEKAAPNVAGIMSAWLADPAFAGVRGPEALAKLPEAERQPWEKLWKDVADLLKRAQHEAAPKKEAGAK
jgi:tetratricopeptide (TPR) repeat protein/tRNA A-37 threonylcarbamoyl transferase component Bud32